ncbi:unnamed protein product [Amoebophrya sp. A25]|nr:unnamed protein product [Amoebophrya sp. A25]|eukprot:GSA25T00011102001.1
MIVILLDYKNADCEVLSSFSRGNVGRGTCLMRSDLQPETSQWPRAGSIPVDIRRGCKGVPSAVAWGCMMGNVLRAHSRTRLDHAEPSG